jgi:Family of unknown function (DUF5677)
MPRRTKALTADQVLAQIKRLERYLNNLRMVPATNVYRSKVILPLFSKALTLGRAICVLLENGFPAEAFGMSRTLVDIYLYVRYMSNKDSEARITAYVEYWARVHKEWGNILEKHYPQKKVKTPSFHGQAMKMAQKFASKHQWTGLGGQAKLMALEEDTVEKDEKGQPWKSEFDYDVIYFWTSHYVHATIIALTAHSSELGEVFRIRPRQRTERDLVGVASFNTLAFISRIIICGCRVMNHEQPERILEDMHKLMKKFATRKAR